MSTDPAGTPDTLVPMWRMLVRRNPGWAASQLSEFLDGPHRPPDPVAVDLEVLLAEALLAVVMLAAAQHRIQAFGDALDAGLEAARTAGDLDPADWPRLATALIVHMDTAVCAGNENAAAAAADVILLVSNLEEPDPGRLMLIRALQAVAVYHHEDGERGKRELARLREACTDEPIIAMLAEAEAAMAEGLQASGSHYRPAGAPPPLRGGVLQPRLDDPAAGDLAYRVRCWPAHRAGATGAGADDRAGRP